MARRTIRLIGPQAKDRSFAVSNQETLNFITSIKGDGSKAPVVLESAPGLVDVGAAGSGPCRSPQFKAWRDPVTKDQNVYAVFGRDAVCFSQASGVTVLGQLADLSSRVRIARGRTHLMFVDGSFGYTWDGTTFAQISDPDFPDQSGGGVGGRPTHVVYQDGVFIVNDADSDNFYISGIENPTQWNPLDFEAASVAPDNSLAIASTNSMVWIIGDATAQAYYNSGNADFPYAVILNATQEYGIKAPQSIAESKDGVFYVGTTPEGGTFVYQIIGQQGRIISTDAIEDQLSKVDALEDAFGYIYSQAGKSFYVLQLGLLEPTLVYNITAQAWESRARVDGSSYRIGGAGAFLGRILGGSRTSARLYALDLENYSDAGQSFIRRRVTEIYHVNGDLLDWHELTIDVETGVGNPNAPGDDPQLRLRYSDDSGKTWSSQLLAPLGREGEAGGRCTFRNLGSSRQRIYEIEVADPVPVTLIAAYAQVELLRD